MHYSKTASSIAIPAAAPTEKAPRIVEEFSILCECIEQLNNQVNYLLGVIKPVMAAETPAPSNPRSDVAGMCELASAIRVQRMRIADLTDVIEDAKGRVQL